jgi:hypothetical protein
MLQSLKDALAENMSTNMSINSTEWIIEQVDISVTKHKVTLHISGSQTQLTTQIMVTGCGGCCSIATGFVAVLNNYEKNQNLYLNSNWT